MKDGCYESLAELKKANPKAARHVPAFKNWGRDYGWSVLPFTGWVVTVCDLTPELAGEFQARMIDNQRTPGQGDIERYALDMINDDWKLTHQGIAFNVNQHCFDGNHRCGAVTMSGATIRVMVFFGVGDDEKFEEMSVIDTNRTRSAYDMAQISGIENSTRKTVSLLNAAIRFVVPGGRRIENRMTRIGKMDLFKEFMPRAAEVESWFGQGKLSKKIAQAPVKAAIFLATYHVDHEVLKKFVKVFNDEQTAEVGDAGAVAMRQYMIITTPPLDRDVVYLKACKAILHFCDRKELNINRLYACDSNPFPNKKFEEIASRGMVNIGIITQAKKAAGGGVG
jgi:hypothetical protein